MDLGYIGTINDKSKEIKYNWKGKSFLLLVFSFPYFYLRTLNGKSITGNERN